MQNGYLMEGTKVKCETVTPCASIREKGAQSRPLLGAGGCGQGSGKAGGNRATALEGEKRAREQTRDNMESGGSELNLATRRGCQAWLVVGGGCAGKGHLPGWRPCQGKGLGGRTMKQPTWPPQSEGDQGCWQNQGPIMR